MSRVPYGWADAGQHPVVAALQEFFCHRPSIWLNGPPVSATKPATRPAAKRGHAPLAERCEALDLEEPDPAAAL